MKNGWIKLHRSITKWEWWSDHNTARLFIYLLLEANHEDVRYMGVTIKRGQLATSLTQLAKMTGISVQSVRTSLTRLKSTQEITQEVTSRYSIITICKYEDYQLTEEDANTQTNTINNNEVTRSQHATNTPIEQEYNNISSSTSGNARAYACEDDEENYFYDAFNDFQWRELVQMQVLIEQEKISEYLYDFRAFCLTGEKKHHSRADYRIHFMSWLKMQLKRNENNSNRPNNGTNKKCFTIDEIDAIVQAGIGNADTERR